MRKKTKQILKTNSTNEEKQQHQQQEQTKIKLNLIEEKI